MYLLNKVKLWPLGATTIIPNKTDSSSHMVHINQGNIVQKGCVVRHLYNTTGRSRNTRRAFTPSENSENPFSNTEQNKKRAKC
ncbi:hypothetical protein GDO78_004978 [Eleutherodactylus coqui]|uniref:Uncharacterized protein n=1 Tax=Eleutherodactylus coqui TaxID=57060 RepID=A0A8J6KDY7_ELECQ|nr:hypothetical protein GDO78_004978 [Eleutherodactylus coqui]